MTIYQLDLQPKSFNLDTAQTTLNTLNNHQKNNYPYHLLKLAPNSYQAP